MEEILCPCHICFSYTAERESLDEVMKQCSCLIDSLKYKGTEISGNPVLCQKKNEGFKTASKVQYVARCGNFIDQGA